MTAPATMLPRMRWEECDDCQGDGFVLVTARVAGEAFDADWREERCAQCDGAGGWELPVEADDD